MTRHDSKPQALAIATDPQLHEQVRRAITEHYTFWSATDLPGATALLDRARQLEWIFVDRSSFSPECAQLLGKAHERFPSLRRVMLADPSDLQTIVIALHAQVIDHLVHLPLDVGRLEAMTAAHATSPVSAASGAMAG
jgi:DNA-binding NtrC family response regulator